MKIWKYSPKSSTPASSTRTRSNMKSGRPNFVRLKQRVWLFPRESRAAATPDALKSDTNRLSKVLHIFLGAARGRLIQPLLRQPRERVRPRAKGRAGHARPLQVRFRSTKCTSIKKCPQ